MRERMYGRIKSVTEEEYGSRLAADTPAGATDLVVTNLADFPAPTGCVVVNDKTYGYSELDYDTSTIHLDEFLAAAADAGDAVSVWDPLYERVAGEKRALVQPDGDMGDGDAIDAVIAQHLHEKLEPGIRGNVGESVLLEHDRDGWRIIDAPGLTGLGPGAGGSNRFYDQDVHVVITPGDQTATLTYTPLPGSVHMRWNEVPQQPTEFTVAGRTVTIPDPTQELRIADRLWFMYAYSEAGDAIVDQPPAPEPPWWEDIDWTCGGAVWGRPTGYYLDTGRRWYPPNAGIGAYHLVVGGWSYELINPPEGLTIAATPVFEWGNPVILKDRKHGIYPTQTDFNWAMVPSGDITPNQGGIWYATAPGDALSGKFEATAGDTNRGSVYVEVDVAMSAIAANQANYRPIGLQITVGSNTVGHIPVEQVGYTNICAGRYYLGQQIRSADVGDNIAAPYL